MFLKCCAVQYYGRCCGDGQARNGHNQNQQKYSPFVAHVHIFRTSLRNGSNRAFLLRNVFILFTTFERGGKSMDLSKMCAGDNIEKVNLRAELGSFLIVLEI